MKKLSIYILAAMGILLYSCNEEEFLDVQPLGSSSSIPKTAESAEALVINAYGTLDARFDNLGFFEGFWPVDHGPDNWVFADLRSGDAYKGGGGTGDNPELIGDLENQNPTPSTDAVHNKWRALHMSVATVNQALRFLEEEITDEQFPKRQIRIAEMKALRAHFYFDAIKNFGTFVYFDESVSAVEAGNIENSYDDNFLWGKIEEDLNAAIAGLPTDNEDLGRFNKISAYAYLCKVQIYQGKWNEAINSANIVIESGKYGLVEDIERLYSEPGYGNFENVFAVQFSIDDGSEFGNLNFGTLLNSPDAGSDDPEHPYLNGDDFNKPSQHLVNAYKVGPDGLPLFDSYNNEDVDEGDLLDPRLDHTVGRPGITWKDWEAKAQEESWSRDIGTYGFFVHKKNIISPNSPLRSNPNGFPWALGALDLPIIKYSDVLLWKAEASIETGDIETARILINQIRNRAKNAPFVKDFENPSMDAANYLIEPYPAEGWNLELATKALRYERHLEFALEGQYYYDLVRWGIADNAINDYLEEESTKRSYLQGVTFNPNKAYLPVPQVEIDITGGVLKQRQGY